MSATGWEICPKCRQKAMEYIEKWNKEIDKQYGKVDLKTWEKLTKSKILLTTYYNAWKDEKESIGKPQESIKLFEFIEEIFPDFEYSNIDANEGTFTTVRYDSDTGLGDDGLLRMSETYSCECCDFSIEVNKTWKQGINQEHKEK